MIAVARLELDSMMAGAKEDLDRQVPVPLNTQLLNAADMRK